MELRRTYSAGDVWNESREDKHVEGRYRRSLHRDRGTLINRDG